MEKLLNLLNKYMFVDTSVCEYLYNKEVETIYVRTTLETGEIDDERVRDEWIISKRFGFIKWLIENDKIDFENQAMQYAKEDLSKFLNERKDKNGMSDEYAMILMLLAISDSPIQDLCVWLK